MAQHHSSILQAFLITFHFLITSLEIQHYAFKTSSAICKPEILEFQTYEILKWLEVLRQHLRQQRVRQWGEIHWNIKKQINYLFLTFWPGTFNIAKEKRRKPQKNTTQHELKPQISHRHGSDVDIFKLEHWIQWNEKEMMLKIPMHFYVTPTLRQTDRQKTHTHTHTHTLRHRRKQRV